MKIWVGVTDEDWFSRLSRLKPDEVNFWQPSGSRMCRALQTGEPFLFKLHSPRNFIVGGGYFVRYSALPASLAWDAFGEKNGVASFDDLRTRIHRYRRKVVPCGRPFSAPDWTTMFPWGGESDEKRFGAAFLTRARLGQGAFRVLVTDAYERRCAVTGEKTLPVLEAAHIKPFAENGPHRVNNGLLLRSDLHKLFDLGYLTVTPELRLHVSLRLKADWQNGREYSVHDGEPLRYHPPDSASRPSPEFLKWHNESKCQP